MRKGEQTWGGPFGPKDRRGLGWPPQARGVKHRPRDGAVRPDCFVHASGRYVDHWCDTWGGKFSAVGTGVRNGNSVEFRSKYPEGPFFNTFTWSSEKKQWTMRLENGDAGRARSLFALETLEECYAQAIWTWPSGPCIPSPYGLSTSSGLEIVIQP